MVATWYFQMPVWSLLEKRLEQKLGFVGRRLVFFCFAATQLSLSLFNTKIWVKAWVASGGGDLGWPLSFIFAKSLCTASPFECLGLGKGLVQSRVEVRCQNHGVRGKADRWTFLYSTENIGGFPSSVFLAN